MVKIKSSIKPGPVNKGKELYWELEENRISLCFDDKEIVSFKNKNNNLMAGKDNMDFLFIDQSDDNINTLIKESKNNIDKYLNFKEENEYNIPYTKSGDSEK